MDSTKDAPTLLVIAAPEYDATAYHLSGFLAPDPVIYLRVGGESGKRYLAVSSMEYGRAKRDARADEVLSFDELDVMNLARELKSGGRALAERLVFADVRSALSAVQAATSSCTAAAPVCRKAARGLSG